MCPFPVDPESKSQQEHFAVVLTRRTNRKRFPEACVTTVSDRELALQGHDPDKGLHAAVVYGPSVSSESQRIYHLIRWLA